MRPMTFNSFDPHLKKVDMCLSVLCQIEREKQVDYPCMNKESGYEMARILINLDNGRDIATIRVYSTFIRIIKAESSSFKFGAVVEDAVFCGIRDQ